MDSYTVVNYVVEARNGDRPWFGLPGSSDDEDRARKSYDAWLASKRSRGFGSATGWSGALR